MAERIILNEGTEVELQSNRYQKSYSGVWYKLPSSSRLYDSTDPVNPSYTWPLDLLLKEKQMVACIMSPISSHSTIIMETGCGSWLVDMEALR